MSLPLGAHDLAGNAARIGLNRQDGNSLTAVAFEELQGLRNQLQGQRTLTAAEIAQALAARAVSEANRSAVTQEQLESVGIPAWQPQNLLEGAETLVCEEADDEKQEDSEEKIAVDDEEAYDHPAKKFKFTQDGLNEFFGGETPYCLERDVMKLSIKHSSGDIITALCQNIELAVEIGKHLPPKDLLNLFSVSKTFHRTISGHLLSSVRAWVSYNAPDAGKVFAFNLFRRHLIPDPVGRRWIDQDPSLGSMMPPGRKNNVRMIPGIKYLQLVIGRVRYCREIMAIMARNGHRLPKGMLRTLVRLWLVMEVATTRQRQAMMKNKDLWTERDLYNAQFFLIKLGMHFNDPVYGPTSFDLVHVIMGQKGLYPLHQLLMGKKYNKLIEFVQLKIKYDYNVPPNRWNEAIEETELYGVSWEEVGLFHCEGWGYGDKHLLRPDELVPMEAVRRGLELDKHLMDMVVWGYIDFETGENLVPTEDEIYISDDEEVLKHMDTRHHWKRKHALKKRWVDLTQEQRQEIMRDDEDERLRAMAFAGDEEFNGLKEEDDVSSCGQNEFSLDEEIERGVRLFPRSKDAPSMVPDLDDQQGWVDFANDSLLRMGRDPEPKEDLSLHCLEDMAYNEREMFDSWDWKEWGKVNITEGGLGQSVTLPGNEGSSADDSDEPWAISDELIMEEDDFGGQEAQNPGAVAGSHLIQGVANQHDADDDGINSNEFQYFQALLQGTDNQISQPDPLQQSLIPQPTPYDRQKDGSQLYHGNYMANHVPPPPVQQFISAGAQNEGYCRAEVWQDQIGQLPSYTTAMWTQHPLTQVPALQFSLASRPIGQAEEVMQTDSDMPPKAQQQAQVQHEESVEDQD
ncbi:hypothetical protein AK830_g11368 [Neonectria ditissima]|uniref:F-box domain-containing protein n=1 Tax=Neonectria ditissima TaxID=78410 RepID=A0A0P7B894_9HYPO|nr:hypothetical protein AK830_g11368 [Neonectria ditissima]